jgi:hypothetical protein
MRDEHDSEIEVILDAYDRDHDKRESEVRQTDEAGAWYDDQFRQLIASVIRPYFEEVARQLQAHGHPALVEEGSVSSPDHRLAGGSKITLAFLPKDRSQQGLRHQLELNDAPHFMLRCDKLKMLIELYQDPDPSFMGGTIFGPTWSLTEVCRDNLKKRVLPMIREALDPVDAEDVFPVGNFLAL